MRMKLSGMLALLGVTIWAVVAGCKSTGHQEAPAKEELSSGALLKYSCGGKAAETPPIAVTMDCCRFVSNAELCVPPNTPVTFKTSCTEAVQVRFANTVKSFSDGGPTSVSPFQGNKGTDKVLPGDAGVTLTTWNTGGGGRYTMTVVPAPMDAGTCPIEDDSMSGSLDVATSGPKPEE